MAKKQSKTGGGRGTNQYQIKGVSSQTGVGVWVPGEEISREELAADIADSMGFKAVSLLEGTAGLLESLAEFYADPEGASVDWDAFDAVVAGLSPVEANTLMLELTTQERDAGMSIHDDRLPSGRALSVMFDRGTADEFVNTYVDELAHEGGLQFAVMPTNRFVGAVADAQVARGESTDDPRFFDPLQEAVYEAREDDTTGLLMLEVGTRGPLPNSSLDVAVSYHGHTLAELSTHAEAGNAHARDNLCGSAIRMAGMSTRMSSRFGDDGGSLVDAYSAVSIAIASGVLSDAASSESLCSALGLDPVNRSLVSNERRILEEWRNRGVNVRLGDEMDEFIDRVAETDDLCERLLSRVHGERQLEFA